MKYMKKVFLLLLVFSLVLSISATGFAEEAEAEKYSITINGNINNDGADHTYEAYQIFTGNLGFHDSEEGTEAKLGNIQWGESVDETVLPEGWEDAASVAARLDVSYTSADKLTTDELIAMIELSSTAFRTSTKKDGNYVIEGLPAGYYLVKDQSGSLANEEDAYTEFILEVVENSVVNPKASAPTLVKKVKDVNDSTGVTTKWQDSADYDIGDAVPFQLTATLASNVSAYKTYAVEFVDTLSPGLTLPETSENNYGITVKMDEDDVTEYFEVNVTKQTDGETELTISCEDVKAFGAGNSAELVVSFTATLNKDAAIGDDGNPNTAYLIFSNNPANSGTPNEDPDKPGTPPEDPDNGKTPEDKVVVFTYQVIVNKKNQDNNDLPGAAFTLYKKISGVTENGGYVAVSPAVKNDAGTSFTFKGLDDGDYKLVENQTPPGYNTVDDIYFTISAEDHTVEGTEPTLGDVFGAATGTSADNFTFMVTAIGALSVDVVNKAGVVLPETGGTGTTLIYAVGGVLAVAALVLLITKKRMSSAE